MASGLLALKATFAPSGDTPKLPIVATPVVESRLLPGTFSIAAPS